MDVYEEWVSCDARGVRGREMYEEWEVEEHEESEVNAYEEWEEEVHKKEVHKEQQVEMHEEQQGEMHEEGRLRCTRTRKLRSQVLHSDAGCSVGSYQPRVE